MIYLSLDCIDLILQARNHAVEFCNLVLGVTNVISMLASRGFHVPPLEGQEWKSHKD